MIDGFENNDINRFLVLLVDGGLQKTQIDEAYVDNEQILAMCIRHNFVMADSNFYSLSYNGFMQLFETSTEEYIGGLLNDIVSQFVINYRINMEKSIKRNLAETLFDVIEKMSAEEHNYKRISLQNIVADSSINLK